MNKPFRWAIFCVVGIICANYIFFSMFSNQIFLDDYVVIKSKFEAIKSKQDLNYILIGDSPVLSGFIPDQKQFPSYNFAVSCPSNFELYNLIKKFDFQRNKIKKIFFSTHFLSFTDQEHCFEHLILNYNIISVSDFLEAVQSPGFLNYVSYQSKSNFIFNLFLLKIYMHPEQFALVHWENLIHDPLTGREKAKALLEATGYINERSQEEFPFEHPPGEFKSKFKIHPFQEYYLHKFLSFLDAQKVEVVFYHPLYFEGYKNRFSSGFLMSIDEFYNKLTKKYPLFRYHSLIQFKDKDYFNDAVHPNKKGAEFYSRWVYQQEGLNVAR